MANNSIDVENWLSLSNLGFNFIKECTDLKTHIKLDV